MKTTLLTTLFSISISLLATSSRASELYFELRFRGDIDGDGKVTVHDGIGLQEYLLDNAPTLPCPAAADANADGTLGHADVVQILNWATETQPHPDLSAEGVAVCAPSPAVLEELAPESFPVTATVEETADDPSVPTRWSEGDWNGDGVVVIGTSITERADTFTATDDLWQVYGDTLPTDDVSDGLFGIDPSRPVRLAGYLLGDANLDGSFRTPVVLVGSNNFIPADFPFLATLFKGGQEGEDFALIFIIILQVDEFGEVVGARILGFNSGFPPV